MNIKKGRLEKFIRKGVGPSPNNQLYGDAWPDDTLLKQATRGDLSLSFRPLLEKKKVGQNQISEIYPLTWGGREFQSLPLIAESQGALRWRA